MGPLHVIVIVYFTISRTLHKDRGSDLPLLSLTYSKMGLKQHVVT